MVKPAPGSKVAVNSFTVTPSSVSSGELVLVAWSTSNAKSVTLDGAPVALIGTQKDRPTANKTYTLVAKGKGPDQSTATCSVAVAGAPPPPPPPPPQPVDCVLSAWSDWAATTAWTACVGGVQSRTEERLRTIVTPPANGGAACGPLSETRTVTQACVMPPPPPTGSGPLASLAENTARNLGPYWDAANVGTFSGQVLDSSYITDYSGIAIDAARNRILHMGGGHGFCEITCVRVLDLATLTWSDLYPSIPMSSMVDHPELVDTVDGKWLIPTPQSFHPTQRHTYNGTVVRGDKFVVVANRGMPHHLGAAVNETIWGGRTCVFDLNAHIWSFGSLHSFRENIVNPISYWDFDSAACLDPTSNKILIAGAGAGGGNLWLYDPDADTYVAGAAPNWIGSGKLVYYPPNDKFYYFYFATNGNDPIVAYEIALNRSSVAVSTVTLLTTTGPAPTDSYGQRCGLAYDSVNKVIGGMPSAGLFYTFDPPTRTWTATTMQIEAGSTGVPYLVGFNLDFDPGSGCYIFLQNNTFTNPYRGAWAYRFKGVPSGGGGTGTQPPPVGNLSVTLDFGNGSVASFSQANAIDKGDYVGEFVHQKCYLATDPNFPDWRVWFRPDADGTRDEVVVEYGRSVAGTPAHRLTSYVATVKKSGTTVYTATVPQHFWFSRWRYQSSQRPIVRTPATLKTRKWLPNFGTGGMYGGTGAPYTVTWPGPMGTPARPAPFDPFNPAWSQGGDHEGIGYLSEAAASYVLFGGSANLTTVRTEGEWMGNACIAMRDDATGDMCDFRSTSPTVWFKQFGGMYNAIDGALQLDQTVQPNFISIDYVTGDYSSHTHALAILPWMLFDDPFHLESLQFMTNIRILAAASVRAGFNLPGAFPAIAGRGYAWSLRDAFYLAKTTPASTPGWLKPQSYWQSVINDNLTYSMKYVNSPARLSTVFRTWTPQAIMSDWQGAWQSFIVGMACYMGFTEWRPVFDWSIGLQIAMTNGTSGWNKQWPMSYGRTALKDRAYYDANYDEWRPFTNTSPDPYTCTDWADNWVRFKNNGLGVTDFTGLVINDAGWDGHTLMPQFYANYSPPTMHYYERYFLYLRSALAMAVTLGTPGAQACYDYINNETGIAYSHWSGVAGNVLYGQARVSIDPQ